MGLADEAIKREISRENYAKTMLGLIKNDLCLDWMPAISVE